MRREGKTSGRLISVWVTLLAVIAGALYLNSHPGVSVLDQLAFIVPLVGFVVSAVLIPRTESTAGYYAVQALVHGLFLASAVGAAEYPGVQVILLIAVLGEVVFYEPYPTNLAFTVGTTALVMLGGIVRLTRIGIAVPLVLRFQAMTALPGFVIAVFGSYMTRYRELVVGLGRERDRLRSSVVELTKMNSAYQDYAVVAQEHATEQERQRITRDIHDIVGYTLTNNLMLMESAMDLMQENALALPSIIETARENAQEGLDQVRAAMYKLRERQDAYPIGLNAIARLARVFEKATGISVKRDFANMPLTVTEEIDSVLYHLVQESLVNAFRHGAATEVAVSFWYAPGSIQVHIRDNGSGSDAVVEGIGLQGMRERLVKVGGTLDVYNSPGGFTVRAVIEWSTDS